MEKRLKQEMRPFLTKYNLRDLSKKNLCSLSTSQREEAYKHLNTLTASNNGKLVTIENVVPKYFLPNYGNSCDRFSIVYNLFLQRILFSR